MLKSYSITDYLFKETPKAVNNLLIASHRQELKFLLGFITFSKDKQETKEQCPKSFQGPQM